MPEYMLSVHHSDSPSHGATDEWTEEQMQRAFEQVDAFNGRLKESGAWVFAGGLMPRETATTVDHTGEAPVLTDGPFAESKEWLGGFWVIDVADLDEALRWAGEGSRACAGKVEVRPFQAG